MRLPGSWGCTTWRHSYKCWQLYDKNSPFSSQPKRVWHGRYIKCNRWRRRAKTQRHVCGMRARDEMAIKNCVLSFILWSRKEWAFVCLRVTLSSNNRPPFPPQKRHNNSWRWCETIGEWDSPLFVLIRLIELYVFYRILKVREYGAIIIRYFIFISLQTDNGNCLNVCELLLYFFGRGGVNARRFGILKYLNNAHRKKGVHQRLDDLALDFASFKCLCRLSGPFDLPFFRHNRLRRLHPFFLRLVSHFFIITPPIIRVMAKECFRCAKYCNFMCETFVVKCRRLLVVHENHPTSKSLSLWGGNF